VASGQLGWSKILSFYSTDESCPYDTRPAGNGSCTDTQSLTLEERAKKDSMPDSVITTFGPKLNQSIEIVNLGWRFPRLDFIAAPTGPLTRLIGP
jgi:hypothetical protein